MRQPRALIGPAHLADLRMRVAPPTFIVPGHLPLENVIFSRIIEKEFLAELHVLNFLAFSVHEKRI